MSSDQIISELTSKIEFLLTRQDQLERENQELRKESRELILRVQQFEAIEQKYTELKEENARAVYKIKTDEGRKLLGFIPVKVEKILTIDAANTEAKIIEEESPWWTFLTIK